MVYTSVSIFNFFLLRLLILFRRHSKTEKFACGLAFKIEKKPQQYNCSGAGEVADFVNVNTFLSLKDKNDHFKPILNKNYL